MLNRDFLLGVVCYYISGWFKLLPTNSTGKESQCGCETNAMRYATTPICKHFPNPWKHKNTAFYFVFINSTPIDFLFVCTLISQLFIDIFIYF